MTGPLSRGFCFGFRRAVGSRLRGNDGGGDGGVSFGLFLLLEGSFLCMGGVFFRGWWPHLVGFCGLEGVFCSWSCWGLLMKGAATAVAEFMFFVSENGRFAALAVCGWLGVLCFGSGLLLLWMKLGCHFISTGSGRFFGFHFVGFGVGLLDFTPLRSGRAGLLGV